MAPGCTWRERLPRENREQTNLCCGLPDIQLNGEATSDLNPDPSTGSSSRDGSNTVEQGKARVNKNQWPDDTTGEGISGRYFLPKTSVSRVVVCAAGFLRILVSS